MDIMKHTHNCLCFCILDQVEFLRGQLRVKCIAVIHLRGDQSLSVHVQYLFTQEREQLVLNMKLWKSSLHILSSHQHRLQPIPEKGGESAAHTAPNSYTFRRTSWTVCTYQRPRRVRIDTLPPSFTHKCSRCFRSISQSETSFDEKCAGLLSK